MRTFTPTLNDQNSLLPSIKAAVEAVIMADQQSISHVRMTDQLRQKILQALIAAASNIPHPASGLDDKAHSKTLIRWQILAYVAGIDLTIAKWFESHLDALSILNELGYQISNNEALGVWAVWAAQGHPDPIRYSPSSANSSEGASSNDSGIGAISGAKSWCSGAHIVDHGLISYRDDAGHSQLLIVDMQQSGIKIDSTDWQAVGMQPTDTATIYFNQVLATKVGSDNAYLDRAGFWHGAAGVAACWFGAAATLADYLLSSYQQKPTDFKAMYLGEVSSALTLTQQYFYYAAKLIDDQPQLSHELSIRQLRANVEQLARLVIDISGQALGAAPLCQNAHFARLSADLAVFIRQSHGAFDLQKIGELTCQLATDSPENIWQL